MKIVIDPGHGLNANVGICDGYREGNTMFALGGYLRDELQKYQGVTVVMTRDLITDDPEVVARGTMAANADILLSLHSNAAGSDIPSGTEIYDTVVTTRQSTKLAQALGEAIAKILGSSWRGLLHRYNDDNASDYYGVLRGAMRVNCHAALLIEHGFHTNPGDCARLQDPLTLQVLAKTEAMILAEFYGLKLIPPMEVDVIYRVQVGAYAILANAQSMRSRLMNDLGIPAFITPLADDGFYRVQVGAYSVYANAQNQVEVLKSSGYNAIIKKGG